MFLWIVEAIGLAMITQEFTLKITDVRIPTQADNLSP